MNIGDYLTLHLNTKSSKGTAIVLLFCISQLQYFSMLFSAIYILMLQYIFYQSTSTLQYFSIFLSIYIYISVVQYIFYQYTSTFQYFSIFLSIYILHFSTSIYFYQSTPAFQYFFIFSSIYIYISVLQYIFINLHLHFSTSVYFQLKKIMFSPRFSTKLVFSQTYKGPSWTLS